MWHVHTCRVECMHLSVYKRQRTLDVWLYHSLPFLNSGFPTGTRTRLSVSKPQHPSCFSSPQHRGYKHTWSRAQVLTWVVGSKTSCLHACVASSLTQWVISQTLTSPQQINTLFPFFIFHFLFYVYGVFCLCVFVHHVYSVPVEARRGFGSPETGVTGNCEPPHRCWELNTGPLKE